MLVNSFLKFFKYRFILFFIFIPLLAKANSGNNHQVHVLTQEQNSSSSHNDDFTKYMKILDQYKEYVSKVNPSVRKEITEFRLENAKLINKKRELYRKLSLEAQSFLMKEQEYRAKLPTDLGRHLNLSDQVDVRSKQSN